MQNYSLEFHFSWDSTLDFTTTDIVTDSIRVTEQRFNNLRSSSSTINLDINPDDGLLYQRLLRSNEGDIRAKLYAGSSLIFTGYVSRNLSWEVSSLGSSPVALSIESTGTRKLQKKLVQEDGVGVYDTPYNIIDNICTLCGITFDDSGINSADNPELYVSVVRKVERSETCEDLLDDLLFELGYVDWFDETGALRLQKIDLESTPVRITEDDLYEVQGNAITLTSQARQYTSATVKYSEMRTRQNVNVYQVDTSSNYITLDNISSLWWDGEYHDSTETPAPATVEMNDIDAGQTILWFDGSSLVTTMTPVTGATAAQPAPTLIHRLTPDTSYPYRDTDKVDVLIDNTTALKPLVAYSAFAAKGTVITVDENTVMTARDGSFTGSDYEYEYETSWIHDKIRAESLAVRMAKYNLYCNSTYNFYTKENIPLGSVVTVTDTTFAHASVMLFITGRTYTRYWFQDEPCYRYVGQAVSSLISQFVPSTSTSGTRQQFLPNSYTYIRYSEYADGHDMVETPTADTKYIGTYSGPSAYCPPYTEFKWSQYASEDPQMFDLIVSPTSLIQNRRLTGSQDITATCQISGYTGTPTISYWFNDSPEDARSVSAPALTINVPYNNTYSSLTFRAEITGADPVEIKLLSIDRTEEYGWYGHLHIDTQAYFPNGEFDASCWDQVDWTDIDNELPAGERFLNGDSFFNEFTSGSFTDVYIYVFLNGVWYPIPYVALSDREKSVICARSQKAVLSTIDPGSVTKSDFAYFNTIIAGTVTSSYIGSQEIEVQDGGFIYGGAVDLTQPAGQRVTGNGAGFVFDSIGNAEMSNIRITGDSTIEGGSTVLGTLINYDTQNNPVFKTVKEASANVTIDGSKTDGTDAPNAYVWSSFTNWLKNRILARASNGSYYSSSGTLYGYWSGSSLSGRSVIGLKYWSSLPAGTTTTVHGDRGAGTAETKTMYTNPNDYTVTFTSIICHPKTKSSIWGSTGYGSLTCTTYDSNGRFYQTFNTSSEGEGQSGHLKTVYNVSVPPHGYIECTAGTYSGYPWGSWDTDLYLQMRFNEGDFMSTGINLIDSGGTSYPYDTVFPAYNDFITYPQDLTCSGLSLSLDMQMQASSTWPVEKFYRFTYTTSPSTSATVTTSIFSAESFTYRGSSKNVASITYSNSILKVTDTTGQVYDFTTAAGNYYPRHSFAFTTLNQSLGTYTRSLLPTDDLNVHDIGSSTFYDSGNPQRWDTGFFKTLDISQGIVAKAVNAGIVMPVLTTAYTVPSMDVGTVRPFYCQNALTLSFSGQTMSVVQLSGSGSISKSSVSGSFSASADSWVLLLRLS